MTVLFGGIALSVGKSDKNCDIPPSADELSNTNWHQTLYTEKYSYALSRNTSLKIGVVGLNHWHKFKRERISWTAVGQQGTPQYPHSDHIQWNFKPDKTTIFLQLVIFHKDFKLPTLDHGCRLSYVQLGIPQQLKYISHSVAYCLLLANCVWLLVLNSFLLNRQNSTIIFTISWI